MKKQDMKEKRIIKQRKEKKEKERGRNEEKE